MNNPIELELGLQKFFPKLKTIKKGDSNFIWDLVRKKWLILTPEETVRQLLVIYLLEKMKIPLSRLSSEKAVVVNNRSYRYDLLIFDAHFKPLILVECKASSVSLTTRTFEQAANYNRVLKVPYILISNGPKAFIAKIDFKKNSFLFLDSLPKS